MSLIEKWKSSAGFRPFVGITLGIASLFAGIGGSTMAEAKAPPPQAWYQVFTPKCFTKDVGWSTKPMIGAKVPARMGVTAQKNNAIRRMEMKYRMVPTTPGARYAGFKTVKSTTNKYSDTRGWTFNRNTKQTQLSTNLDSMGGDYNIEIEFVWVRANIRPNWKKKVLYSFNEAPCESDFR